MKITALLAVGILAACQSIASAVVLVDFDSQADYTNHFTNAAGSFSYNASAGGLRIAGSTNIGIYAIDTGTPYGTTFLNDDLSLTFQQGAFGVNPSMGLVARASDASSGIVGLVYLNSASAVRLRIAYGALSNFAGGGNLYDTTFSGLSLATSDTFTFTLEEHNASVGSDLFAEFRITLLNVATGDSIATSGWQRLATANTYTAAGAAGIRAFADASHVQTIYSFAVIPEPSTLAFVGIAGVALAGWRKRRKSLLSRRSFDSTRE